MTPQSCATPVLSLAEAPSHPHNAARGTFVNVAGLVQPAPAPRFSRTPLPLPRPPALPGNDTLAVLAELGLDAEAVAELASADVVRQAD